MKYLATASFALSLLISLPALALDLHEARTSGAVGEKPDGYVTAVQPSPEVSALVDDINTKRRQEYARISKQNGQPTDVVAKLAAQEIITKLDAGNMYQDASGAWKKR